METKKTYQTPELKIHGSVEELTQDQSVAGTGDFRAVDTRCCAEPTS